MANDAIAYYRPGEDITCHAVVALTGCRLCAITAGRQSGPGLSATAEGGNYQVTNPAAGGKVFGVVGYDTPAGGKVPVKRHGILPVLCVGALAANDEVEVLADGRVQKKASGAVVGIVYTPAADATLAEVQLYERQG